jgi:hypothetical protein
MPAKTLDPRIDVLLQTYDQAFDKTAWHGTNLLGSLRRMQLPELLWRPGAKRHNCWEIALHCAYWKYVVWRRITGAKRGSFPRKPSDWPNAPVTPSLNDWKEDLELLIHWHRELRDLILQLPPARLKRNPTGSKVSIMKTVYGISSHDLYHAGQIQLLKRLVRSR